MTLPCHRCAGRDGSGWLDRDEIEHAIMRALRQRSQHAPPPSTGAAAAGTPAAMLASPLGQLPVRAMREVLSMRGVPHDDVVEKVELVRRCVQSVKSSRIGSVNEGGAAAAAAGSSMASGGGGGGGAAEVAPAAPARQPSVRGASQAGLWRNASVQVRVISRHLPHASRHLPPSPACMCLAPLPNPVL